MSVVHSPPATGNEMLSLLSALTALRQGRGGVRLPEDWTGVAGKVADAFNEVVEQNERLAEELARLSRVVGKDGRLSQRLSLGDVSGYRAQSESLDAWITECNRGRDGCFVADWDALLARLSAPASAG